MQNNSFTTHVFAPIRFQRPSFGTSAAFVEKILRVKTSFEISLRDLIWEKSQN